MIRIGNTVVIMYFSPFSWYFTSLRSKCSLHRQVAMSKCHLLSVFTNNIVDCVMTSVTPSLYSLAKWILSHFLLLIHTVHTKSCDQTYLAILDTILQTRLKNTCELDSLTAI